jgi:hypothetical protein
MMPHGALPLRIAVHDARLVIELPECDRAGLHQGNDPIHTARVDMAVIHP